MVWPTISGKMVESRDQVLITWRWPPELSSSTLRKSFGSMYGPFFSDRLMRSYPRGGRAPALWRGRAPALLRSAADDELVRRLLLAGALAHCRLAPGRLRLPADRRLALATAMRMVARVHRRAAHGRPAAQPAATP